MEDYRRAVLRLMEEEFGEPLALPPLPPDIAPFPDQGEHPTLFGSSAALAHPLYLLYKEEAEFFAHAPDGYLQIGFWGYPYNSFAFFYCSATPNAKVLFRPWYGGAYGGESPERLLTLFRNFTPFLEATRPVVSSLEFMESMGNTIRRIQLRCGAVLEESQPSLLSHSDHWLRLWGWVARESGVTLAPRQFNSTSDLFATTTGLEGRGTSIAWVEDDLITNGSDHGVDFYWRPRIREGGRVEASMESFIAFLPGYAWAEEGCDEVLIKVRSAASTIGSDAMREARVQIEAFVAGPRLGLSDGWISWDLYYLMNA